MISLQLAQSRKDTEENIENDGEGELLIPRIKYMRDDLDLAIAGEQLRHLTELVKA